MQYLRDGETLSNPATLGTAAAATVTVSLIAMQYLRDGGTLSNPATLGAAAAAAVAATYYLYSSRPEPRPAPLDFDNQSIQLPDGSRTSVWAPNGQRDLIEYLYDDCQTTHDCFKRGLKVSGDLSCLGTRNGPNREYTWLTYNEVYDRVQAFGSGLLEVGLEPRNDTFVGIYSSNRVEWVVTEQACSMYSMVTIALYDTLGPDTCAYIIRQANISVVVCDKASKAQLLLDKAGEMDMLKTIIIMDTISQDNRDAAEKHGVKLVQYDTVLENGRSNPREAVPPQAEDLALICYTSGTTGDPKGVLLSHRNLMSNLSSIVLYATNCGFDLTKRHCHISYLPLAHVFERGVEIIMFMHGSKIGFFSGDVRQLTDDMQALHPTIFATVPRLLNRMYDKVQAGVKSSFIKSKLFEWAIAAKTKELKQRIIRNNSIWDKLVFGKIQKLIGGNVQLVFTASAPLEPKVLDFTRCAFGCVVVEGYGQTESTAGIAFNILGEHKPGHVGPPLPGNVVKLVDVPEMDYFAKDNTGEIVCKGPNVFGGYYKNPEKTAEALDEEGWLHTGDIGTWTDVIAIHTGANNIPRDGADTVLEKLEDLCAKILHTHPSCHILVSAILPRAQSGFENNRRSEDFLNQFNNIANEVNQTLCRATRFMDRITFVEFPQYVVHGEVQRRLLSKDGLHLSFEGTEHVSGALKIIDRKKNIFKLSQGEYVAAEKVENTFMRSEFVAQVFVEGDSLKPFLMGVIVPDEEVIVPWARKNGISGSFKEICENKKVKDTVLKDVNDIGKKAGLKGFELVKDIVLYHELFSVENGLLTPTFKNKRPQLRKFFKKQVGQLYSIHNAV